jgi:hypothetical protein
MDDQVQDAWLAGLYEGEGSCSFVDHRLQLQIKMTDRDVLEHANVVAGVGSLYGPYHRHPELGWKPYWCFMVYVADDIVVLVERMRPYLFVRRLEQINVALTQWQEYRTTLGSDVSRFFEKVEPVGNHLMWRGGTTRGGYGQAWVDGPRSDPAASTPQRKRSKARTDLAHRIAWRISGRELPARVNLRNRCGESLCVCPEHWERADQVCSQGHVLEANNVTYARNGKYMKRSCVQCLRSSSRQAKERARGQKLRL